MILRLPSSTHFRMITLSFCFILRIFLGLCYVVVQHCNDLYFVHGTFCNPQSFSFYAFLPFHLIICFEIQPGNEYVVSLYFVLLLSCTNVFFHLILYDNNSIALMFLFRSSMSVSFFVGSSLTVNGSFIYSNYSYTNLPMLQLLDIKFRTFTKWIFISCLHYSLMFLTSSDLFFNCDISKEWVVTTLWNRVLSHSHINKSVLTLPNRLLLAYKSLTFTSRMGSPSQIPKKLDGSLNPILYMPISMGLFEDAIAPSADTIIGSRAHIATSHYVLWKSYVGTSHGGKTPSFSRINYLKNKHKPDIIFVLETITNTTNNNRI